MLTNLGFDIKSGDSENDNPLPLILSGTLTFIDEENLIEFVYVRAMPKLDK